MFRIVLRCFTALLFALIATSGPVVAEEPVSIDLGFGSNGFAPIPQVAGASPIILPFGFVHLPQSGNYLSFSLQTFSGTQRIVSSKLLENGSVDVSYGNSGSLV